MDRHLAQTIQTSDLDVRKSIVYCSVCFIHLDKVVVLHLYDSFLLKEKVQIP